MPLTQSTLIISGRNKNKIMSGVDCGYLLGMQRCSEHPDNVVYTCVGFLASLGDLCRSGIQGLGNPAEERRVLALCHHLPCPLFHKVCVRRLGFNQTVTHKTLKVYVVELQTCRPN